MADITMKKPWSRWPYPGVGAMTAAGAGSMQNANTARGSNGAASGVPTPKAVYKVRLIVDDMDRSLQFYSGFLGIRVAWTEEKIDGVIPVAGLEINDMEVVLTGPGNGRSLAPGTARGAGIALYLEVEDIRAWFNRAVEMGYTPLSPATMKPVRRPLRRVWGEIVFALRDPDGYDIRMCQLW